MVGAGRVRCERDVEGGSVGRTYGGVGRDGRDGVGEGDGLNWGRITQLT